jgi:oligoribonuclease NrnB/cAMP/cGMP phosphodiesterase (DHH superfamily)
MTNIVCLYHADCLDGFVAMLGVMQYAKKDDIPFVSKPMYYGDVVPYELISNDTTVYIVDFSFDSDTIFKLSERCKKVYIFDHHHGWKDEAAELQNHIELNNDYTINVVFDESRSGALITWQELELPVPDWVRAVSDRDLWKREIMCSFEICHALLSHGLEVNLFWLSLLEKGLDVDLTLLIMEGLAIVRARDQMSKYLVDNSRTQIRLFGSETVDIVECPRVLISETLEMVNTLNAHYVTQLGRVDVSYAIGYHVADQNRWKYSLRADHGNVDLSIIAKRFGGGGHRRAASFYLKNEGYDAVTTLERANAKWMRDQHPTLIKKLKQWFTND